MTISLLISILLQLGIINNFADFDETITEQYINEIESSNGIIVDDGLIR